MPEEVTFVPHNRILRFGQMIAVVDALQAYGLETVRITGGEPLVRRGLAWLVRDLHKRHWLKKIGMTTNGYLLGSYAERLFDAGLRSVNVSLDTVDPDRYEFLTRRPFLGQVLEGIRIAKETGYTVKINSVLIRGNNDQDLVPLVEWAGEQGVELRFIEFMPFGDNWDRDKIVSATDTLERISRLGVLTRLGEESGHTQRYRLQTAAGTMTIGVIPAVTEPFCNRCDRLRLTATGDLMSCMFDRSPVNVHQAVVGYERKQLQQMIGTALSRKPNYLAQFKRQDKVVGLHSIGG